MNAKYDRVLPRAQHPPGPGRTRRRRAARGGGALSLPAPPCGCTDQRSLNRGWEGCLQVDIKQPRCLAFICAAVLAGDPGAPLIRHVRSTIKQRGPANSLLQLGELNAITRVVVTDRQIPVSHLPPDACYKVKSQGRAFPSNYLPPAIILRIL